MSGSRYRLFGRVALLGTGLMGGSLGMAIRECALAEEVVGYDRDSKTLATALERGAVDRISDSPQKAVEGAELVILAVPIRLCGKLVESCAPHFKPGAVITDLGSTKQFLEEELSGIIPDDVIYIGGHPMTGSEESGIEAADPALLENAIYVLTPEGSTPEKQWRSLVDMIVRIGAQPLIISPAEHDRIVALVSHLPHLAAVTLANVAAENEKKEMVQTLAAGGFRDTTRIAMGNPEVWRDIFATNREAIGALLTRYIHELENMRRMIEGGKEEEMTATLDQARSFRRKIPFRSRGILPELFDIIVLVKDTPGMIGRIASLVGEAGFNIAEVEILHVREEEGGSIRFGFRCKEQRDGALAVLKERGYRAHRR